MNTHGAIAARIMQLCRERGITPNGLGYISSVPSTTIKNSRFAAIFLRICPLQRAGALKYIGPRPGRPGWPFFIDCQRQSIKNILNGESQNPGTITIKKLCDGLEITLGACFSTPEFDTLEQEICR